jgi:hypothetical protein
VLQVLSVPFGAKELVLNQSFDPTWSAYERCGGWHPLRHESANGFANGFQLSGCGDVALINWAQAAFVAGVTLALLALTFALLLTRAANRAYRGRAAD